MLKYQKGIIAAMNMIDAFEYILIRDIYFQLMGSRPCF